MLLEVNIYKLIEEMRAHPGLYLGTPHISTLRSFLDGYQMALHDFNIKEIPKDTLLPLPFDLFHDYVALKFDYYESTSGWCNMILDQTAYNEENGWDLFHKLLDEFKQLYISQCFSADLNNSNIAHYTSGKFAPNRSEDKLSGAPSLYYNPLKILYAELKNNTNHKSYIDVVQTTSGSIIGKKLYKREEDILAYFESSFGTVSWQKRIQDDEHFCEAKV